MTIKKAVLTLSRAELFFFTWKWAGAWAKMSKVAFLASFLAAFITMDEQFFEGKTTRQICSDVDFVVRQVGWTITHSWHSR